MGLYGLVEGGVMPDIPRKLLKAEKEKTVSPTEAHGNRYVLCGEQEKFLWREGNKRVCIAKQS